MPRIDLSAVAGFDADGALQETAANAERLSSRRRFLRNAGLTLGGAAAAGMGVPSLAAAAASRCWSCWW